MKFDNRKGAVKTIYVFFNPSYAYAMQLIIREMIARAKVFCVYDIKAAGARIADF